MTVSVYIDGRALPLYWTVWNKRGVSSLAQQQHVLNSVLDGIRSIQQLSHLSVHVVADREFASPKLAEWLWQNYRVHSALRLKKSIYLSGKGGQRLKVAHHLNKLKPNQKRYLQQQQVSLDCDFRLNVVMIWKPDYKEPWIIMTTLDNLKETCERYGERFSTEPMYKDCKGNIFDIENTRATQAKRIERLLLPIAVTLAFGVLEGWRMEEAPKHHKKKRSVGLAWLGIRVFSRAFRALELVRLKAFWQQLFSHYRFTWVEKRIPI